MSKRPYTKPWLSVPDQVELLKSRGLVVNDVGNAERLLNHVGYYRLRGYALAFEVAGQPHKFVPGTTIEQLRDAVDFDARLRRQTSRILSVIETDLRTTVASAFGKAHGPFGHIDVGNFLRSFSKVPEKRGPNTKHEDWLKQVRKTTKQSAELFARHFKATYVEFPDLPIWAATEVMTFGSVCRMVDNLKRDDLEPICEHYEVSVQKVGGWLLACNNLRNSCAHHARVWDRLRSVPPGLPKSDARFRPPLLPTNKRIFATLMVAVWLARRIDSPFFDIEAWIKEMKSLLEERPNVPNASELLGMPQPSDCLMRDHPLWDAVALPVP